MDLHFVRQPADVAEVDAEGGDPVVVALAAEIVGACARGDAAHRAVGADDDRGGVAALASRGVGADDARDASVAGAEEVGEREFLDGGDLRE